MSSPAVVALASSDAEQELQRRRKELDRRLETFVKYFLVYVQTKLLVYRLIATGEKKPELDELTRKSGENVGEIAFSYIPIVGPIFAKLIGKPLAGLVTDKLGSKILNKEARAKVRDYSDLLLADNAGDQRTRQLVGDACEIFFSLEDQLMTVDTDLGWERAVKTVAELAAKRSLRHYRSCKDVSFAMGAVTREKERNKVRTALRKPFCQNVHLFASRRDSSPVQWDAVGVFEWVGFTTDGDYYVRKDGTCRTQAYGYRRLVNGEAVGLLPLCKRETGPNRPSAYLMQRDDVEGRADAIVEKIASGEATLSGEDMKAMFEELKDYFATVIDKLKDDLDNRFTEEDRWAVQEVQRCLRSLDFDELRADVQDIAVVVRRLESNVINVLKVRLSAEEEASEPHWFIDTALSEPYVLRVDLLEELRRAMDTRRHVEVKTIWSRTVVLSGLRGCGKTQLARKYAEEFHAADGNVFLVTDTESFYTLAETLDVKVHVNGRKKAVRDVRAAVYAAISRNARNTKRESLFIIDGAERYDGDDGIERFMPTSVPPKSYVPLMIVVSPHTLWDRWEKIEVAFFNPAESLELVRRTLKVEDDLQDEDIATLARELGHYPLALNKSLTLMFNNGISVKDYLAQITELNSDLLDFVSRGNTDGYPKTVYAVMSLTLSGIEDDLAVRFWEVAAYLLPDYMPRQMFTAVRAGRAAVELLKHYKVIAEPKPGRLTVCRVAQQFMRLRLERLGRHNEVMEQAFTMLRDHAAVADWDDVFSSEAGRIWSFVEDDDETLRQRLNGYVVEIRGRYRDRETFRDTGGQTGAALYTAVCDNDWDKARDLIAADRATHPDNDLYPLLDADFERLTDVIKYLARARSEFPPSNDPCDSTSFLFKAVSENRCDVARYLLDNGTQYLNGDPLRPGVRPTLLHEATVTDNADLIRLVVAETKRRSEVVGLPRQLAEYINVGDRLGDTALMYATEGGRHVAARTILEECRALGGDVVWAVLRAVNQEGETAMHWAAKRKCGVETEDKLRCVEVLREFGADVDPLVEELLDELGMESDQDDSMSG